MSDEAFRNLLLQVRARLGDRVLVSRVGIALREIDPAFTPKSHDAPSLTDLLGRVPEVGVIEGATGQKEFVFTGAAPPSFRLSQPIWQAVTEFKPSGRWHLDLESFQLRHSARDPEMLLETEGERFVALPTLGADFQRRLARTFVAEHLPAQRDAVEQVLSGSEWLTPLLDIFESAGLASRWRTFRAQRISEEVLAWAERHGVARERLLDAPRLAPATPRTSKATGADSDLHDMRALLHDAIDMMGLQELAALNVPPAYLALAASRQRRVR
ncbi:MAG: hypothetical protein U0324_27990 [Polyangiales bacterium]